MESILLGVTDRTILVFIPDPASTDGSGKTGLTHSDLMVSYSRVETDNDVTVTDVTSSLSTLTNLTDAHADWGVKEVSATLAPGLYRLDVADAVFASGAWYAVVYVQITSGLAAAVPKAFQLVAYNPLDGVRLGLAALPNAAADAPGGLPISDAGGLDLDALNTAMTGTIPDSIPADGSRPTPIQALLMMTRFLFERGASGTTVTVNKEDGTTASFTLTLDDGTTPTAITRAT